MSTMHGSGQDIPMPNFGENGCCQPVCHEVRTKPMKIRQALLFEFYASSRVCIRLNS
jgi:hypothetical protein